MSTQDDFIHSERIADYENWFAADQDNQAYIAAKFITNFTKSDRAEIYQYQQNLGWPKKVVRAAAQMESAIQ
jgi:hypothetical protein